MACIEIFGKTICDPIPDQEDWEWAIDKVGNIISTPIAVIADALTGRGASTEGIYSNVARSVEGVKTVTTETIKTVGDTIQQGAKELEDIGKDMVKPVLIFAGIIVFVSLVFSFSKSKVR